MGAAAIFRSASTCGSARGGRRGRRRRSLDSLRELSRVRVVVGVDAEAEVVDEGEIMVEKWQGVAGVAGHLPTGRSLDRRETVCRWACRIGCRPGQVGSGRVGSGRVGSGRVGLGWVWFGLADGYDGNGSLVVC